MSQLLTTADNPYNPFTHWDEWFSYDMACGYNTPGLIARYTVTSDELSDREQARAIELAIMEIMLENSTGFYQLVSDS